LDEIGDFGSDEKWPFGQDISCVPDHAGCTIQKGTLKFSMKRVCCDLEKCYIFYTLGNQYIYVCLQVKCLSIAGRNLDEN